VDFGLSFNDKDQDDLTRVNEEVGNRFLYLPEQARGGRFPTSDVTQLAGVILFVLTGHEPRVLRDESGRPPHERAEVRSVLNSLLGQRQLIRVMSVFDKAFTNEVLKRYETAPDLISALEDAMHSDREDGGLDDLVAQVDEVVVSRQIAALSETRETLEGLLNSMTTVAKDFVEPGKLRLLQTMNAMHVKADDELRWRQRHVSVVFPGDENERNWVPCRIERRGSAGDYVALLDGEDIWRGESADDSFTTEIQKAVAEHFLATHANPNQDTQGPP
jgi:serine/threonine-protein kinase